MRNISKVLLIVFVMIMLSACDKSPQSDPTARKISDENYFGCISKEYLNKLSDYAGQKDHVAFQRALSAGLLSGTCIRFTNGESVFLTDIEFFAEIVKVRRKGDTIEYWTPRSAVAYPDHQSEKQILAQKKASVSKAAIEKLTPPEALEGSLQGLEFWYLKEDRGLVIAWTAVPFDIKREQVKPTLLALMKRLKSSYPDANEFTICLDPGLGQRGLEMAGQGMYSNGTITIHYGIPNAQQIKETQEHKKKVSDPKLPRRTEDTAFMEFTYDPDYEPVRLMSKEEFDFAAKATKKFWELHEDISDEEALFKETAQSFHQSVAKVKPAIKRLTHYYGLHWGTEKLE